MQELIIVAQPSWDGNYAKSTVELARALRRYHRIIYVDYAYTLKDVLSALLKACSETEKPAAYS